MVRNVTKVNTLILFEKQAKAATGEAVTAISLRLPSKYFAKKSISELRSKPTFSAYAVVLPIF